MLFCNLIVGNSLKANIVPSSIFHSTEPFRKIIQYLLSYLNILMIFAVPNRYLFREGGFIFGRDFFNTGKD